MKRTPTPQILKEVMLAWRRAFTTVGAFSLFVNLLVLTVPLYMIQIFDRVMTSHSADTLTVLTIAAAIALAVMAGLEVIRSRLLVRIGLWTDARLGPAVFKASIMGKDPASQSVQDLAHVRNFLTGPSILTILDAPWAPLLIAVVFVLHPVLGVLALAGAIGLFALAYLNDRLTGGPIGLANQAQRDSLATADAIARQKDSVDAMGMTGALTQRWSIANAKVLHLQAIASDRAGVIVSLSRFYRLVLQVGVLGTAAFFVIGGELTAGAMIAASIILTRALAPVEQAISVWRTFRTARGSLKRIGKTLERGASITDVSTIPVPQGRLQVNKAAQVPEGAERPVLAGLSFAVIPGQVLGVTGPSGAGKSTLARMLVGVLPPTAGDVRLDGVELYRWRPEERGRHVGYVPQVLELLPGSVHENISRFTNADPDAVFEAAHLAGVHGLIMSLPQGYDTQVGGPNDPISGGARQRIALARAVFGQPRLVVMDEPYSNLDAEGHKNLEALLDELKARGTSVVVISHRPSILARADRVLMLQEGRGRMLQKPKQADLKVLKGGEDGAVTRSPARIQDRRAGKTEARTP